MKSESILLLILQFCYLSILPVFTLNVGLIHKHTYPLHYVLIEINRLDNVVGGFE